MTPPGEYNNNNDNMLRNNRKRDTGGISVSSSTVSGTQGSKNSHEFMTIAEWNQTK